MNNAEQGVNVNQEVVKNLEEINEQVIKVNEVIKEIAAASDQQIQGIEQIDSAINQLNQFTQQNAANSEESASTAEELSSHSSEMQNLVSGFKLTNTSSNFAINSNGQIAPQLPVMQESTVSNFAKNAEDIIPLDDSDIFDEF